MENHLTNATKLILLDWINLDFGVLPFIAVGVIIFTIGAWIKIIINLQERGWWLLLCWLLLNLLAGRFLYSWNRNDSSFLTGIVIVSALGPLLFLMLQPEWVSLLLLKRFSMGIVITLLMYFTLLERNQTAFLYYRLAITGNFEYPPYHTFKKEMDWKTFFRQHPDRKWTRMALTSFFEDDAVENRDFRTALFVAWSNYNKKNSDKILFDNNGITALNRGHYSALDLCADKSFLVWWVAGAKVDAELALSLIDFCNALDKSLQNHYDGEKLDGDLKSEMLLSLSAAEASLRDPKFENLLHALQGLKARMMSLPATKREEEYYQ